MAWKLSGQNRPIVPRGASGLAREPAYRLNFAGYLRQPIKLSLYVSSRANSLTSLIVSFIPGAHKTHLIL